MRALKITTTNDCMPADFNAAARLLARPYIKITSADVERIEAMTKNCGDIVIHKGKRMTWGNADGGFALMPLVSA